MELMGLFLFTQLYRLNPTLCCLCATSAVCARLYAVRARLPLFVRDFRCSCATSAVCARLSLFVWDFTTFVRDFAFLCATFLFCALLYAVFALLWLFVSFF